jgi:hypothetical protein
MELKHKKVYVISLEEFKERFPEIGGEITFAYIDGKSEKFLTVETT